MKLLDMHHAIAKVVENITKYYDAGGMCLSKMMESCC